MGIASHPRTRLAGRLPHAELRTRGQAVYFPTDLESFGYPLAEARVSGQPVIACDTEQNREIAGPALCGCVPGDSGSLRHAVARALTTDVAPDPAPFDPDRYFSWVLGEPDDQAQPAPVPGQAVAVEAQQGFGSEIKRLAAHNGVGERVHMAIAVAGGVVKAGATAGVVADDQRWATTSHGAPERPPGVSVPQIMAAYQIGRIGLMKIDIEGTLSSLAVAGQRDDGAGQAADWIVSAGRAVSAVSAGNVGGDVRGRARGGR